MIATTSHATALAPPAAASSGPPPRGAPGRAPGRRLAGRGGSRRRCEHRPAPVGIARYARRFEEPWARVPAAWRAAAGLLAAGFGVFALGLA
ncbi:hypothetical protein [Streptomyces globosus]|uniref:hypothetical protein n=1 Tax=Streptomyces globosus TaxID=68209 RepID=UPI00248223BE|nr:hypothetical protein [Streptomyces globosus]